MLTHSKKLLCQGSSLLKVAPCFLEASKLGKGISAASKEYPSAPNVGIGVVILRKVKQQCQVLLVRRGKEPQKGLLTFPGGSLELGETMAECAVRETLEETGLVLMDKREHESEIHHRSLDFPRPVDAVDSIHFDRKGNVQYHYTIVDLAAVPEEPHTKPKAADDVDEVFWASVNHLRTMPDLGEHCARIAEESVQRFNIDEA